MELEIINKLFLELSQVATAKTARELELEKKSVWQPASMPTTPVRFETIEPCPYCRFASPTLMQNNAVGAYCVGCRCGARSMVAGSEVLTITYWNNVAKKAF